MDDFNAMACFDAPPRPTGSSEDLNKPGAIGMEMVEEWAKFMSEQGIKNILCLLNDEEHTFFQVNPERHLVSI